MFRLQNHYLVYKNLLKLSPTHFLIYQYYILLMYEVFQKNQSLVLFFHLLKKFAFHPAGRGIANA